jgi:hypothetical protein
VVGIALAPHVIHALGVPAGSAQAVPLLLVTTTQPLWVGAIGQSIDAESWDDRQGGTLAAPACPPVARLAGNPPAIA